MRLSGWVVMLTTMIIFLTFIGIQTSLSPILDRVGIGINTTSLEVSEIDVESSSLLDFLFGLSGLLTVMGIAGLVTIGLYITTKDTNILVVPVIILIAQTFSSTFWAIIKLVMDYNQWWMISIVALIFGGLSVGFIMACVDYFRGQ